MPKFKEWKHAEAFVNWLQKQIDNKKITVLNSFTKETIMESDISNGIEGLDSDTTFGLCGWTTSGIAGEVISFCSFIFNNSKVPVPLYDIDDEVESISISKIQEQKVSFDEDVRSYNVGESDYSKHKIQPWDIWLDYRLNPWEADIVKRILRTKKSEPRRQDFEKIIHIAKELIRQIDSGEYQ